MKHAFAAAALAASFTIPCQAETPAPVPQNLLACSKLQDAAERVRCYDAQIAAMSSATGAAPAPAPTVPSAPPPAAAAASTAAPVAPAAPVVPAASTAASPPAQVAPRGAPAGAASSTPTETQAAASDRSHAAQFGQEELPQAARPPKNKEDQFLSSRITALQVVGANKYLISLENGQVWRQKESDQLAAFFHVGDDVRIERGLLGSYRLWAVSTGEKNWIAVKRMR